MKKSLFEAKIYNKLVETLGYSYENAFTEDELYKKISRLSYKVILIDEEFDNLDLKTFSTKVKDLNKTTNLTSSIVLISDDIKNINPQYKMYVHEQITNVINRDLLRLLFEKFI